MLGIRETISGKSSEQGFSLVELLVAMGILGIAMTAIYSSYMAQQKTFVVQTQVAAMQQNIRAGMHHMVSDIRMAGYDPENSENFGLVSSMSGFSGSGATCNATNIAFTLDFDGDRTLDFNDNEMIAYRLDSGNLQRFTTSGGGTWQTIAQNIDILDFVFLNSARGDTSDLTSVRFVEITVVARTSRPDLDFSDTKIYRNQRNELLLDARGSNIRRQRLTSFVKFRNLGI
jgi:type IV pilus assembly protein PilW